MNAPSFRSLSLSAVMLVGIGCVGLAQSGSPTQSSASNSSTMPGMSGGSDMSGNSGMMSGSGMGRMSNHGSMQGMKGGSGSMQGMMSGGMQQMMKMCGMTPEMMQQGRMIMHAQLGRDDPAAVLGLKDQLKLSDDQAKRLRAIEHRARDDARAVLDQTQRSQLAQYPADATSMAQMHQQMMAHMQQMSGKSGAPTGQSDAPCAMMRMMMNKGLAGSASTTAP